jgi:hypothetical protein
VLDDVPKGIVMFRENDVVLPINVRNAIDKLAEPSVQAVRGVGAGEQVGMTRRTPAEVLQGQPEEINPALLMAWRLQMQAISSPLHVSELISVAGEIEDAIVSGDEMVRKTRRALSVLERRARCLTPWCRRAFDGPQQSPL